MSKRSIVDAPVRDSAVVVLIGANDYGLVAGQAC
jgi:hypothetical protein